jgi:chorismate--pyruvate lyase
MPSTWPSLTPCQKYWLARPGALTEGLRQLGNVTLTVVAEHACGLSPTEAWMLRRAPHSPLWVREIKMAIDGTDCVVARSFSPLAASHGWWRGMRHLRSRPLADMLYHDPQISRSRFFACRLRRQQPLYRTVQRAVGDNAPEPGALLARCSIFSRRNQPLLVAECFLPSFWPLAEKNTGIVNSHD